MFTGRCAEFIGGEKVALWYCAKCGESGALNVEHENVYSVIAGMERHHGMLAPMCEAQIGSGGMMLIRPTQWYAAAQEGR